MKNINEGKAEVLIQALPYIQKFQGKTIVVKYGGNAMINPELKNQVMHDIALLSCLGISICLVHGGGPEIDKMLRAVGIESRFVQGLRYTDAETMEIVQMVLCGKVNKDIAALLDAAGAKAIGLSGIDGGLLKAHILNAELGFVGEIEAVDAGFLSKIIDAGIVPVVSSVAINVNAKNDEAKSLNINADTAAAEIAAALHAEKLILMTDVPGILADVQDNMSLIPLIKKEEIEGFVSNGTVSKGMIPKVQCCKRALEGGVQQAHIIDGRQQHSLLVELFTDAGIGTMIV
ncbi:MAG: acetylglutamate kinase [Spirochaetaceae bacterium]|jgi:acetylglutamate kinase|nr:acetylglutamate kinase [Spirochaetaceae bacterium]